LNITNRRENMNIIVREIRSKLRTFIIWIGIITLFILMYIPFTNQFLEESETMVKFLEKVPKFLLKAFSIDVELFSMPEGIFGSEGMSFIYILVGVFASMMAGGIFAKEFEEKTIEYILVKPISRKYLFRQKVLALLIFVLFLSLIFTIGTLAFFKIFVTVGYSQKVLFGFGLYVLTIQIFFSSIAVLLSVIFQRSSLTTSISLGILIFMYFGNALASTIEKIRWLEKICVFHYLPLTDTIVKRQIFGMNALMIIVVSMGILFVSQKIFEREDILI